jgi:nuclear GTP-binding protein
LLEDEDIANLASVASVQGMQFADKDAAKENAPLEVLKSHGNFPIFFFLGDLIALLSAAPLVIEYAEYVPRSFGEVVLQGAC